jgi:hypothetical protein
MDLQESVDQTVEELNDNGVPEVYSAEIGEHANGPAIDIQKDGECVKKVTGHFFRAAERAGYKVSGINVAENYATSEDHTRLFLRKDERPSEEDVETALYAGVFVTCLAAVTGGNNLDEWEAFFDDA